MEHQTESHVQRMVGGSGTVISICCHQCPNCSGRSTNLSQIKSSGNIASPSWHQTGSKGEGVDTKLVKLNLHALVLITFHNVKMRNQHAVLWASTPPMMQNKQQLANSKRAGGTYGTQLANRRHDGRHHRCVIVRQRQNGTREQQLRASTKNLQHV